MCLITTDYFKKEMFSEQGTLYEKWFCNYYTTWITGDTFKNPTPDLIQQIYNLIEKKFVLTNLKKCSKTLPMYNICLLFFKACC